MSRLSLLVVIGCAAAIGAAAQADYFPLQVGSQWVYRGEGTRGDSILTLEVTRSAEFDGRTYYLLEGFPEGSYWLRTDEKKSLVQYDPGQKVEKVWHAFHSPEGVNYSTSLPGVCCGVAVVSSRRAEYHGPIGDFDYALEVRYPGVFQFGIERELFLPYVGLVHRSQVTGGPHRIAYDLIYARLGGVTHISESVLSFELAVDRTVYTVDLEPPAPRRSVPKMTARITVRNTTDQSVPLTFPTGQTFEFVLKNEQGDVVYRWSDGKFFTQAIRTERFGPGERNYAIEVPLVSADGGALPAGKYTAEAWLTTKSPPGYSASASFEIAHAL